MRGLIKKFIRAVAGREIDQIRQTAEDAAASREFITRLRQDLAPLLPRLSAGNAGEIGTLLDRRAAEMSALIEHRGATADERFLHRERQFAITEQRLDALQEELLMLRRDVQILARTLTLPPHELWDQGTPIAPGAAPPSSVLTHSMICRQKELETDWYAFWCKKMAHKPIYHRKMWEFVYIAQALYERGKMADGMRGLGFGVGTEPLGSLFASYGAQVTGTDMSFESAIETGWAAGEQHAAGKEAMRHPLICDKDVFDRNVRFETFDMTKTPGDFRDFDFCWSSCALEHLGSIEAGLSFIERSIETLKPGGVAVHTTEYNLISNEETVETGHTVLFRRRDFEALIARLERAGHHVAPLDLRPGAQPVERYVDMPPFRDEPHLRLALMGYATTSMGLIVTKGG